VVTLHPPLLRQYGRGLVGFIRDWWILVWWGEAVQDRRGSYGCGGIRFDMAVQVRDWHGVIKDWLGKVRLGSQDGFWYVTGHGRVLYALGQDKAVKVRML
jgi:hypothetical protein